jgi:hypothetical protein
LAKEAFIRLQNAGACSFIREWWLLKKLYGPRVYYRKAGMMLSDDDAPFRARQAIALTAVAAENLR